MHLKENKYTSTFNQSSFMKNLLILLLSCFTCSFFSCDQPISDDAIIHYFISTTVSDEIKSVELDFLYAKAEIVFHEENTTAGRSIYLDRCDCTLQTQNPIPLGNSFIEPNQVKSFSLHFAPSTRIYQNGAYREVKIKTDIDVLLKEDLFIKKFEDIDLTFELDLAASRLEFKNGEETFFPVFEAKISR